MIALPKLQSVIEHNSTAFSLLMYCSVLYLCFLLLRENLGIVDLFIWGPSLMGGFAITASGQLKRLWDWGFLCAFIALLSSDTLMIAWNVFPRSSYIIYLGIGGFSCALCFFVLTYDRFFVAQGKNSQERLFPPLLGVLNTLVGGCASCVFLYFLCRYQSWGDEIRPLPYVDFPSLTSASSLEVSLSLNMLVAVAASITLVGILQFATTSVMAARGVKYSVSLGDLLLQASFVAMLSSWMLLLSCTIYLVCSHGYVSLIAQDCIRSTHGFLEAMVVIVPLFSLLVTLLMKSRSHLLRGLSGLSLVLFVVGGAVFTFAPQDGVPWDVRFDMWSGRLQSALAKTDSMINSNVDSYRLYELKAEILHRLDRFELGQQAYCQAFDQGSRSDNAFEASIFQKAKEKRFDAALITCNDFMRCYPESAAARADLGYVYGCMGDHEKMKKAYSMAANMESKYRFDGWNIAFCNSLLQQSARTEAVAQQEIDRYPSSGTGYYWMSEAMLSQGRYHEAIANGEIIFRYMPLIPAGYELIGRAYFELGINDLALKNYDNAIVLGKRRGSNYYYRSMIYERMGLKDKALKDKQMYKSLGFDPLKGV